MHVPEWFTRNFPSTSLDGELWTGKEQFSELVSIVRRENANAEWEKVRYLIFDDPQIEVGFEKRLDFACRWFLEHPNQFVEVLEQQICEGGEHLRRKLSEIESHGGEGLMLRGPDSPYTIGRSYNLLKVKTYEDAEATVIRHISGSGRMQVVSGRCCPPVPIRAGWSCRMEFNLQSEQAFLIRNETILLLSEALLPLSTMVSTNPASQVRFLSSCQGRVLKRKILWISFILQ